MNVTTCRFCGVQSVVNPDQFCNPYHERAWAAAGANLLAAVAKRLQADPDFTPRLHTLLDPTQIPLEPAYPYVVD